MLKGFSGSGLGLPRCGALEIQMCFNVGSMVEAVQAASVLR